MFIMTWKYFPFACKSILFTWFLCLILVNNAIGVYECDNTLSCEEMLREGSECIDGFCTNPFDQGCLRRFDDEIPMRVCNSHDLPGSAKEGLCNETFFDYQEIRILGQDWESSISTAWVMQIFLSEILRVPVSMETSESNKTINFYDSKMTSNWPMVMYNYDAMQVALDVDDCRKVVGNESNYIPCGHVMPEVWNDQFPIVSELEDKNIIEPSEGTGGIGELHWFIPKLLAEKDPTLMSYFGMQGEKNRRKLAETFKRPTTWKDYCNIVSLDNCTTNDGIASRYPNNEEESLYFLDGLYKGYFRATEKNDCDANPDNCTGHIVGSSCGELGFHSYYTQQAYHLDIAVESDGPVGPNNGYDYSSEVEIWLAANATRSPVLMDWYTPDPLPIAFMNTDFEFYAVTLPNPTKTCLNSHVTADDRCSTNDTKQFGSPAGACASEPIFYKKLIVSNLFENTYNVKESRRSPGYAAIKSFQISNLDVSEIISGWNSLDEERWSYDSREATCQWVAENLENLGKFIPATYPRTMEIAKVYSDVITYVAMAFAVISFLIVVVTTALVYKYREKKVFKYAQVHFLMILLLGLLMLSIGAIITSLKPSNAVCLSRSWLVILGFTMEIVPLIIKVGAINKVHLAAKRMKRVALEERKLFLEVFFFNVIIFVFLICWTVIDPFTVQEELVLTTKINEYGGDIVELTYYCDSSSPMWLYCSALWQMFLLLWALVLAFQTRSVMQAYNESQYLAFVTYSHFVFLVLRIACMLLRGTINRGVLSSLTSIVASFDVIFTVMLYFAPKFMNMKENIRRSGWNNSLAQSINPVMGNLRNFEKNLTTLDKTEKRTEFDTEMNTKLKTGGEGNTLFLINVQNDFFTGGSLSVKNSDNDAKNISSYINNNCFDIERIIVSTYERHRDHISHPGFWVGVENTNLHPKPFTVIDESDIGTEWKPRDDLNMDMFTFENSFYDDEDMWDSTGKLSLIKYAIKYVKLLKENGKLPLVIWPEHCLTGDKGNFIQSDIQEALCNWENNTGKAVKFKVKKDHILTEFYSAFETEVPLNQRTRFNWELFDYLTKSDKLVIAGEALSHGVNFTVRDLIRDWPKEALEKIIILDDCTSAISSFEDVATSFIQDATEIGIKVQTSAQTIF